MAPSRKNNGSKNKSKGNGKKRGGSSSSMPQPDPESERLALELQEQYRQEFLASQNRKTQVARATAPPAEVEAVATDASGLGLPNIDARDAELQEQYRQEFLASQNRKTQVARATAPPAEVEAVAVDASGLGLPNIDVTLSPTEDTAGSDSASDTDSVIARRLEQQLKDEELARRLADADGNVDHSAPTGATPAVATTTTATTTTTSSISFTLSRSEQELKDAELARRIANGDVMAQFGSMDFDRARATAPPAEVEAVATDASGLGLPNIDARDADGNVDHSAPTGATPAVATTTTATTSSISFTPSRSEQELKDAELARRIANGDVMAQFGSMDFDRRTASTTSSNGFDDTDRRMAQELQDEELARQYAQRQQSALAANGGVAVLTDAELARRYENHEQDRASRQQAREMLERDNRRRRRRCIFCWLGIFAAVGITIGALYYFEVLDGDTFDELSEWRNDDLVDIDPFGPNDDTIPSFNASDPTDQATYYRWANEGEGLSMEVVSALDEDWQGIFEVALREWDNGSPDSLTLTSSRIAYEYECEGEDGIIKVCNGNYGATKWRGLNEVLLDRRRNLILQSSAKLNEYYLSRATRDQKQYTMCHEIGHGFGLPHWDEDFDNRDLGNCMDYTSRPQDNKTPDESNFIFLVGLYGEIGGTQAPSDPSRTRMLRGSSTTVESSITDEVRRRYLEARKDLEGVADDLHALPHWRRLESNAFGEAHEMDLGDDVVLKVEMLLADE
eukprot:CAMPEP_0119570514 /NCGR_PEP_ID=MMETSP1352-20130426/43646_1 /TAXON_ID=265584 /ORGANISM="Stauroneis constricta, Strain CCMP1120" /LENGTH=739 /DNA_ID=CAMNT_0007620183 /DNA_START=998 /DNA_END=3217 /DNA_ORIENTATION=+